MSPERQSGRITTTPTDHCGPILFCLRDKWIEPSHTTSYNLTENYFELFSWRENLNLKIAVSFLNANIQINILKNKNI